MYRNLLAIALLCLLTDGTYSDTNYRLNTPIVPARYVVHITPYFDTADDRQFTFDGIVSIQFTTTSNTNEIKLHSEGLNFTAADIYVGTYPANVSVAVTSLEFNANYSFAHINLASNLEAGVEYGLQIRYKGPIREDLYGFYRNHYIENGVKKWLGTTQMEPTHARKAFPCFDEPHLKASFQLRIDRPAHYKPSLTNTEIEKSEVLSNGYIREYFYPTPKMSTYLVAFLVSEFEAGAQVFNGTREFGIYSRPEAKNQSRFAFEFGTQVVDALGTYFGIDYYSTDSHLRLDHVALPNFRGGAMENWGLIKYKESLLLYDPEQSPPNFKYEVARIIAHETTHMWFGNLVTCHWWSDAWLNEGFANYFQNYITAIVNPTLGAENQLVIGSVYSAYRADSSSFSAPISNNNVNSPAEIKGHFGTITYEKAGSVIRMIHHLIQDDAFKYGLHSYLTNNSFSSGYPEKLYQGLSEGVSAFNSLSTYSNTNIADIMSSWVTQAGHPLLTVNINYETETVTLTQKRYYSNSSISSNEVYKIPITYTTQSSPNFENTKPVFIMEDRTHEFKIQNISQTHPWIIFNVQETGLYRVNYDDYSWRLISAALKSNSNVIHPLNRAKIVNDLFALRLADEVDLCTLLSGLEFLHKEKEYSVWFAALNGLTALTTIRHVRESLKQPLKKLLFSYFDSAISLFGYDDPSDDVMFLTTRLLILEFACKFEHRGCVKKALSLFKALIINGTEVAPSLRPAVYCTGLRHDSNHVGYNYLLDRMAKSNVANEKMVIKEALGCSVKEKEANRRTSMDPISITDKHYNVFESWLASSAECITVSWTETKAALVQAKANKDWSNSHNGPGTLANLYKPLFLYLKACVKTYLT